MGWTYPVIYWTRFEGCDVYKVLVGICWMVAGVLPETEMNVVIYSKLWTRSSIPHLWTSHHTFFFTKECIKSFLITLLVLLCSLPKRYMLDAVHGNQETHRWWILSCSLVSTHSVECKSPMWCILHLHRKLVRCDRAKSWYFIFNEIHEPQHYWILRCRSYEQVVLCNVY